MRLRIYQINKAPLIGGFFCFVQNRPFCPAVKTAENLDFTREQTGNKAVQILCKNIVFLRQKAAIFNKTMRKNKE